MTRRESVPVEQRTASSLHQRLAATTAIGSRYTLMLMVVLLSMLLLGNGAYGGSLGDMKVSLSNGPISSLPPVSLPPQLSPVTKQSPATSPGASGPVESPDSAAEKLQQSKVPLNVAFAGLALYAVIGLITLVAMIFPPQKVTPTRQSRIVQRLFSVLVIIFCLLRLVYFCFPIAHVSVTVTYIVNQACFMVFFTMFSLIIFFWAEQYHRKFYDTQSVLPRLRNIFIVANISLWSIEVILVVLSVVLGQVPTDKLTDDPIGPLAPTTPSSIAPMITVRSAGTTAPASIITPSTNTKGAGLGGPLYFASVIAIVIVDFVFALGFVIYGVAIFVQKYRFALGSGLRRELITTMIVTCVFVCCFALRMTMFLYRPITGKFMNSTVYRVLAYFIPEIVAVLLQISVVYLMHHGASRNATGFRRNGRNGGGGAFGDDADAAVRPSIEDDVYYPHDLRASSMPAPRENAHERLISPPRPLRQNFSTPSAAGSVNPSLSQSVSSSASSAATPALNSAVANISTALSMGPLNASSSSIGPSSPPTTGPNSPISSSGHLAVGGLSAQGAMSPREKAALAGLPYALASHSATRIGSPIVNIAASSPGHLRFAPSSFSPTHDQPLLSPPSSSLLDSEDLPLQNVGQEEHTGNHDDSESSDYEFVRSDSASLLSSNRRPKRY